MSIEAHAAEAHLADLIQAATAAADQGHEWPQGHHIDLLTHDEGTARPTSQVDSLREEGAFSGPYNQEISPSQIDPLIQGPPIFTQSSSLKRTKSNKRKRGQETAEEPTQEHDQHATIDGDTFPTSDDSTVGPTIIEARAAGVHSASALFRQPSEKSSKYTRPPMSKMFTSLRISPEGFLQLQGAAKQYMLDDRFPDRRECVGQRGRGDTDMVKLKLWKCVKNFLEHEGHGQQFFGEDVPHAGIPEQPYVWPRDEGKIIKLVMPLLRRMVTNERQRQYANITRKGGDRRRTTQENNHNGEDTIVSLAHTPLVYDLIDQGCVPDEEEAIETYYGLVERCSFDRFHDITNENLDDFRNLIVNMQSHVSTVHHNDVTQCSEDCELSFARQLAQWDVFHHLESSLREQVFDILLELLHVIKRDITMHDGPPPRKQRRQWGPPPPEAEPTNMADDTTVFHTGGLPVDGQFPSSNTTLMTLQINVLRNGQRLLPRFDFAVDACPNLKALRTAIGEHYGGNLLLELEDANTVFRAWLPNGLSTLKIDTEWAIAFWSTKDVEWMDGELKLLVELAGGNG